jgi:adenine-specific DNA methylase
VLTVDSKTGRRHYRAATDADREAARAAKLALEKLRATDSWLARPADGPIPCEKVWKNNPIRVHLYGAKTWADLFTDRQYLALATLSTQIERAISEDAGSTAAIGTAAVLATSLDRVMVRCTANCIWDSTTECIMQVFNQGQALPARWEFAEMVPLATEGSGWSTSLDYAIKVIKAFDGLEHAGTVALADAATLPLPSDAADAVVTDPPYYDAVPYAKLSDFFYVWLRRTVGSVLPDEFASPTVQRDNECVVDLGVVDSHGQPKDETYFRQAMLRALVKARDVAKPRGVAVVVFAHKGTAGWEALLDALCQAGWVVTGSWAIDTESGNRLRAQGSAALASSIHLVCRPRENPDGSVRADAIGDWRDVLAELPERIHDWMPRLAEEGVVGADAIFACLGPALEVYSRYSRVEKASGEQVPLKEYLEHVWAAVAKEALSVIFAGAETSGFEEDARLTAMWLWTLSTGGGNEKTETSTDEEESEEDEDAAKTGKKAKLAGFALEYDAARKIAQGLGAHLEELTTLVEVKGETARLLPVAERTRSLFGKSQAETPTPRGKKRTQQMKLGFAEELEEAEETGGWGQKGAPQLGQTVLDRVHQSMILFAAGRGEALRRFLVDESAGRDARFWRLAQALAALYPTGTDERRWVEGVLARKKSLGL